MRNTTSEGAARQTTARLFAAQQGGFQSTMRTGGLGVPASAVRTSSSALLGL